MSSTNTHPSPDAGGGLRKDSLGVFAVTFFVVSAAGPLIAMAGGVPVSMLIGNGGGIPAMFLVAVAILLPFAAGLTAIVPHVRSAGGFYAIAGRGLGAHAAGASAAIAVLSYGLMQLSLFGLFGASAATFAAERLGLGWPWWTYSMAALLLVGWLGYRQVDLSAKVLSVLVVGEYVAVLLLDVAVLLHTPQAQYAAPFTPAVVISGSPWIGLLMCFSAFIGFEATTIYAEEARDPDRTIPVATYVSLLLIGGFYIFSSWCMVLAVGVDRLVPALAALPDPTAFLFRLADHFVGAWLAFVMHVLFLTSIFAGILAFHNSVARYLFAMGRERLLPHRVSNTHPRHRSPHVASVVQSVAAIVLVGAFALAAIDPIVLFARVSVAGTLGIIALMAIASTAVTWFFRARPGNAWRIRVLPLFATIALFVVMVLTGWHFDTLAGDRSPWVRSLPALVLLAGLVGLGLAEALRRSDPPAFERLSRVVP
jgi:amino acid transporter